MRLPRGRLNRSRDLRIVHRALLATGRVTWSGEDGPAGTLRIVGDEMTRTLNRLRGLLSFPPRPAVADRLSQARARAGRRPGLRLSPAAAALASALRRTGAEPRGGRVGPPEHQPRAGRRQSRACAAFIGADPRDLRRRSVLGAAADLRAAGSSRCRPRTRSCARSRSATGWPAADGVPVGRISAQVNRRHLERHQDATGHFGFLEAVDDAEVFAALTGHGRGVAARARHAADRGAVQPVDQRRERAAGRGLRHAALDDDGPCAPLLRAAARGAGLRQGQGPDRLRRRRHGAVAGGDPAADRARPSACPGVRIRPLDMRRYQEEIGTIVRIFNDAWAGQLGLHPVRRGRGGLPRQDRSGRWSAPTASPSASWMASRSA